MIAGGCALLIILIFILGYWLFAFTMPGIKPIHWMLLPIATLFGLFLICFYIHAIRRRVEFFEHGVQLRRPWLPHRSIPYADITEFTFALTRQYYNRVYIGTQLKIKLRTAAKLTISHSGYYKEKPSFKSRFLGFNKDFKPDEKMDSLRDIITRETALAWVDRFERDESLNWCSVALLSPAGLTLLTGKFKNQLLPLEHLRFVVDQGWCYVAMQDEPKHVCKMSTNATNFHTGAYLLLQMLPNSSDQADFTATTEKLCTDT